MATSQETEPSFEDLLSRYGHVPSYDDADDLIRQIVRDVNGSDGPAYWFTAVKLTFTRVRDLQVQTKRHKRPQAKVKPTIGFTPFWAPLGAPVPSLGFHLEEVESDHTEWQHEVIHPRLVAAGREPIRRATAKWVTNAIFHQQPTLDHVLRKLQAIRRADNPFQWGAPCCYGTDPGHGWESAGRGGRIPSLDGEPDDMKVEMLG